MIEIAISIIALAAGVYLLAYVKQNGLGSLYKYLSWLVVLLSLGFILCGVARFAMHSRQMQQCTEQGHCGMHQTCAHNMDGKSCAMHQSNGSCCKEGKSCCKEKMSCCEKGEAEAEGEEHGEGKEACHKEGKACCNKAAADSTAKK